MNEKLVGKLTVEDDGAISVPKEVYDIIAKAAKLKYNFRGNSKQTVKKYVKKYIEDCITESMSEEITVAVPNEFLPRKKTSEGGTPE